ncbi:helix-turn-helix domain-containing protein [Streptomyces sp. NPDC001985]|uniref:helix-turn-helix domain-containing protein n=1 Tax=Streptomyces sp. NPDC001985 TaxID=3154406 RepID=UPI00332814C8
MRADFMNDDHENWRAVVCRVCRLMDASDAVSSLDELARSAGYSRFHFHRMFKAFTGVTPHEYMAAGRARRVRAELRRADTVSEAIYNSGFNSNGRFYAVSADILGMTPGSFRSGGRGTAIHYAVGTSSLGAVLVATADRGVCAVLIGDRAEALRWRLGERFPHARLVGTDPVHTRAVRDALSRAEPPRLGRELPAGVRRVAMAQRIRQLMRREGTDTATLRRAG